MTYAGSMYRLVATVFCALWLALTGAAAHAQGSGFVPWKGTTAEGEKCTGGQPEAGPYDYLHRNRLQAQIAVVEQFHFDEDVEKLRKGLTGTPMNDIDYTLRAIPNHHRALRSAVNYRLKRKKWPRNHQGEKAECYLQRAIGFSPNDPTLHPLLAFLLHRLNHQKQAIPAYREAIKANPNDVMLKYNMGLALVDLSRYAEARTVAKEVYSTDFPLPGLKNRLVAAGKWDVTSGKTDDNAEAEAALSEEEDDKAATQDSAGNSDEPNTDESANSKEG